MTGYRVSFFYLVTFLVIEQYAEFYTWLISALVFVLVFRIIGRF